MATASLSFSFSVDGPGESIDFAFSNTLTLSADTINRRSTLVSSTLVTVWQSVAHTLGSDISSYLPSMLIIGVVPTDGGTLTSSDIFEVGCYSTVISSGAAGNSGNIVAGFTLTKDGVICLPITRSKLIDPSTTAYPDAITLVKAIKQTGSNNGRLVVIATN